MTQQTRTSGVQSVGRALDILEIIDAAGGQMALIDMSAASQLPMPTIHRIVRTLVDRSYLRQLPDRRYALGSRLIPLGNTARDVFGSQSDAELAKVVDELGETANLAALDGDMLVYVGQVPSPKAMRMFTELGRHVHPHCRAAGKALLSQLTDERVRGILQRVGMPAVTPATITSQDDFIAELARVRREGIAREFGEMEEGVVCLSAPVPSPSAHLAVSISGPQSRMTEELQARALPVLRDVATRLSAQLA
ncbi:IclR family transcriptional regulator [Rudaeicoccus suwonensis]|uniref:IclR family transcriptional regulator n=1 Tax=Rudaeicoccus suwonensis TaxID=657409 RepID=A0A561E9W4_9MICO|nr:IclR family transcriptional regulator [Rudaeicoccus suwonensis]TWE12413.1 IclR family transcriptional regulator [Rudaeicoccus suwonensis]